MAPDSATRAGRAQGIGLIEALLAMLALSLALAALLHLQAMMQVSAEQDRRRLEALAVLQSLHERLRLGDPSAPDLPVDEGMSLQTHDLPGAIPGLRARHSEVRWTAPHGMPAVLALDTLLPADPIEDDRLAAAVVLMRAPPRQDATGPLAVRPRHALIPGNAVPLGDGRSAWQPHPDLPGVWLIDERTGAVIARCGSLATRPDGLRQALDCLATGGLLIGGVVRFSTDALQPGAAEAESPLSPALPLDLAMRPASPGDLAPSIDCGHDAPTRMPTLMPAPGPLHPPGIVRYLCVVAGSGSPPRWSGRLELVPAGWTIGTVDTLPPADPARRVCRYSADHDRDGQIDNAEHPPTYLAVDAPLGDQNFLVVRASAACPRDTPPSLPGSLDMNVLDDSTLAHQPP